MFKLLLKTHESKIYELASQAVKEAEMFLGSGKGKEKKEMAINFVLKYKKIKRIIIYWTAGGWFPNATDKEHYHFLIDKNGKTINGKHKVEDNINCNDGKYAAHCGGGNTGSIGVAMCGMLNFKNSKNIGS